MWKGEERLDVFDSGCCESGRDKCEWCLRELLAQLSNIDVLWLECSPAGDAVCLVENNADEICAKCGIFEYSLETALFLHGLLRADDNHPKLALADILRQFR